MKKTKHISKNKNGICYLVGAGPGDPGLLTVRGSELLHQAEVVIYDYLCNPILLQQAPATAEKIYVGKVAGDHTLSQEEINELLVTFTKAGKCVVRLKGGDPFLFWPWGRGGGGTRSSGNQIRNCSRCHFSDWRVSLCWYSCDPSCQ